VAKRGESSIDRLARYVALLVYQDGGIEQMVDAAGDSLCRVVEEAGADKALTYILIGVARGLASFDDPELRRALAEGREEAEYLVETVAYRAKHLIMTQSPNFYRAVLDYIGRRCRGGGQVQ